MKARIVNIRMLTAATLAASGALLSACVMPYEQLSFPGPIDPPHAADNHQTAQHAGTTRRGISLAGHGSDESTEERVYKGSGEFVGGPRSRTAQTNPTWAPEGPVNRAGTRGGIDPKDGVTINLVSASVGEVAKTILGDILGVNYIVSERVKATITLRTSRPVDKAGVIEIFEAVLRAEGAALVVEGGVYKIIPSSEAAAGGAPLRPTRARTGSSTVGLSTEIVPLRYVAAPEMERILKSAAPQAGVLRVDSARNLLILSGTRTELASMRELIEVFDIDSMRAMSFGLYPIETSDPEAIAHELDTIFANDKDGPTKGIARFIGNRRLKSVLVISSRPEYIQKAATWIARIDKAARATDKQIHVYHVQHRPVAELGQLLQRVYGTRDGGRAGATASSTAGASRSPTAALSATGAGFGTTTIGTTAGGAAVASTPTSGATAGGGFGAPAAATAQPGDLTSGNRGTVGTEAVIASDPSTFGAADGSRSTPSSSLPPDDRNSGITVVIDEPNNSLIITATAAEYRRVRRVLEVTDRTPSQVLLEATIAEVSLNDEMKLGVRWFFQKGSNQISFTDASGIVSGPFTGFAYFFNSMNIKAVINALSTVTNVDVLSQPTLMALENKKATLQVGNEVPILTQTAVTPVIGGAGNTPIVNSVSYRNTGVILGITPRVGEDGRVLLDIEQEVSDVVASAASGIQSPTFQQRRVKTTVTVRDGETIILAGMIQDKSTRVRDQVPLIGTIPFFGNLFKNKTDTINRTELLIAITPQVIRDDSQVAAIAQEYRDSINFSTRPQRKTQPSHAEDISRLTR